MKKGKNLWRWLFTVALMLGMLLTIGTKEVKAGEGDTKPVKTETYEAEGKIPKLKFEYYLQSDGTYDMTVTVSELEATYQTDLANADGYDLTIRDTKGNSTINDGEYLNKSSLVVTNAAKNCQIKPGEMFELYLGFMNNADYQSFINDKEYPYQPVCGTEAWIEFTAPEKPGEVEMVGGLPTQMNFTITPKNKIDWGSYVSVSSFQLDCDNWGSFRECSRNLFRNGSRYSDSSAPLWRGTDLELELVLGVDRSQDVTYKEYASQNLKFTVNGKNVRYTLEDATNIVSATYKFYITMRLPFEIQPEHTWGAWTKGKDGIWTRTCTNDYGRCGEVETHTHSWSEWQTLIPATPTSDEVEQRQCSSEECKHDKEQRKVHKGHLWTAWTKSEDGTWTRRCTSDLCGIVENHTHTWSEWKVVTKATDTVEEVQERRCIDEACGHEVEQKTIHSIHVYPSYDILEEPTAGKDGKKRGTCKICHQSETFVIPHLVSENVQLTATSFPLKKGKSITIKVSNLVTGDRVVSWTSKFPNIAAVDTNGRILGLKSGNALIEVKLLSGVKKEIKVKVQKGDVKTTKISGVPGTITLKKGKRQSLKPVLTPLTSNEKVTYKTSSKKIATVSSKGVITAKKKGKATITVKSGKKTKKIKVIVK